MAMFEVGRSYRVKLVKGDNLITREGELVSIDDDFFVLDVKGVHTGFHLRSGAFAYVELIDGAAARVAPGRGIGSVGYSR